MEARVPSRGGLSNISAPGKSPAPAGRPPRTALWGGRGSHPRARSSRNPQAPSLTRSSHPLTPTAEPRCLGARARALPAAPSSKEAPTAGRPSRTRGGGSQENERRGMAWPWNPFQFHNLFGTPCAKLGAKQRTEIKPLNTALPLACRAPIIPLHPKSLNPSKGEPGQMQPATLKSPQVAPRPPAPAGETPSTFADHRVPQPHRGVPTPRAPTLQRSSRPVWMHSARDTCSRSARGSSR